MIGRGRELRIVGIGAPFDELNPVDAWKQRRLRHIDNCDRSPEGSPERAYPAVARLDPPNVVSPISNLIAAVHAAFSGVAPRGDGYPRGSRKNPGGGLEDPIRSFVQQPRESRQFSLRCPALDEKVVCRIKAENENREFLDHGDPARNERKMYSQALAVKAITVSVGPLYPAEGKQEPSVTKRFSISQH